MIWSFVFVALLLTLKKHWKQIKQVFRSKKSVLTIFGCALFITANWFTYIWAVTNGHVIDTSLGYYINPLISVAFGTIFLREKLTKWQWVALGLAAIGVGIETVTYGKVPWIALVLAVTFAFYGLLKKLLKTEAIISLGVETIVVAPFALIYLFFAEGSQSAISNLTLTNTLLLMLSGVATAIPLLWFAEGARRVSLSMVGFLQYVSPTATLVLGIFFFHEDFNQTQLLSFVFIWIAVLLFTLSQIHWTKQQTRS
jgi:chloramphenicol-sensitive protein RarD